jgi:capsular polysaccharide biosynthesis protein/GGDEF domain-containing protein
MVRFIIYLQALRRNWWIVVLTAAAAAVGAFILSSLIQPVYQTRLQMLIVPNMSEFEGRDLIYSLDTLDQRSVVATYVEVVGSGRIRREALEELGVTPEEGEAYEITAVALPEANVLEVAVTGPARGMVADLANTAADQTIQYISQAYDIYRLEKLDNAPIPAAPISPTPARDASLALVIGLVLGGVLAILRDQLREPFNVTMRQWNKREPISQAYKRSYLEHELVRLLSTEAEQMVMGLVRLEGLPHLELPPHLERDLLRRVVETMQDELPGRDLIGRWDDHTFAVIMRRVPDRDQARRRLEMLQQELSLPMEVYPGGEIVRLSPRLSAVVAQENDTVSSLADRAAVAMVKAEKNGHEPLLYRQEMEARTPEEVRS